jgi:hypothetical protein
LSDRAHLLLSGVLICLGVALAVATTRFPYNAGSPATDLLAPLAALGCGVVAMMAARRARQGSVTGRWYRSLSYVATFGGLLVAAVGALLLAFIFLMCGAYWARDTC